MAIKIIFLRSGEHSERVLYRVTKGTKLRFKIDSTLAGLDIKILTNYTERGNFTRNSYSELAWNHTGNPGLVDADGYAEIQVAVSGSFHYYCSSTESSYAECSGYFVVDPDLRVSPECDILNLDGICAQTVLTKQLGALEDWWSRLEVSFQSGYNMIHFTPIQELGASNSCYSIRDQLKVDPRLGSAANWKLVNELVVKMRNEWQMLSITDLVLNHTSFDSPWIHEHPECGYNLVNSPYLKPAFVFDRVLWQITRDIAAGKYESRGLSSRLTESGLEVLRRLLLDEILPPHRIEEFFTVEVKPLVESFRSIVSSVTDCRVPGREAADRAVEIHQDAEYKKLASSVDLEVAVERFFIQRPGITDIKTIVDLACADFESCLRDLNKKKTERCYEFLAIGVNNSISNAQYHFFNPHGPKWQLVSEDTPLVFRYFTHHPYEKLSTGDEIAAIHDPKVAAHFKAHNGWVMGDDPLRNFAEEGSMVYFKRELIVWGDSVKLRFGAKRESCPYLWDRMEQYARETAEIFDGIRLDNCHSTPLHVAEFIVDTCRNVKSDFYVMAELFTGREDVDNVFVNRLGITSLVREGMNAPDCQELGRQIHRYGGDPVGAFFPEVEAPLRPALPHALFMDYTHDNQPSAVEKRCEIDLLASAAAICMGCYGIGSTRGYDELVPHYIDVVKEDRLYPKWSESATGDPNVGVHQGTGIIAGKRIINELHQELAATRFDQIYVDQVTSDLITVTRHQPSAHQSVIAVVRTAFDRGHALADHNDFLAPLKIPGQVREILFEARTEFLPNRKDDLLSFQRDKHVINGLSNVRVIMKKGGSISKASDEETKLAASDMVEVADARNQSSTELDFTNFPPGSVIIFRVDLNRKAKEGAQNLRESVKQLGYRFRSKSGPMRNNSFDFSALTLVDLNRVLFRCDEEERSDGRGIGTYNVPGYGNFKYCGIAGVKYAMESPALSNNLGHPVFDNVRNGDWLVDYLSGRLQRDPSTEKVGNWLAEQLGHLKSLPRYLIPCYFELFIRCMYNKCVQAIANRLPSSKEGSAPSGLSVKLALGSVQLMGVVKNAPLPPIHKTLPGAILDPKTGQRASHPSLAAGLPHFSSGIFRNWGRDTFIALRGLLLLTGRYYEAKVIILSYAGTLRHGLIPNLLGGGEISRYNCRDAFWWWLYSIVQYCQTVPNGTAILRDPVFRLYPTDEAEMSSDAASPQVKCTLADVISEGLNRHFRGIDFIERNAGEAIDRHMKSEGFHVRVWVDRETGFVYGGNEWNCGTWMDKMGESERAGTRGKPATPRDGAAVELQGLAFASLAFLAGPSCKQLLPQSVTSTSNETWSLEDWASKMKANFDKYYFIGERPDRGVHRMDLLNKLNIYKDTLNSSQPWTDYQLRPNFAVTLCIASEMCSPQNRWSALEIMEKILFGPLGMKTLDPSDWKFNGVYDNDRDDANADLAKGFNYHNGPEWLWPTGFFLRAKLAAARERGGEDLAVTMKTIQRYLTRVSEHIMSSDWRGLTELTNANGAFCKFSCPTQAWSFATVQELVDDLAH